MSDYANKDASKEYTRFVYVILSREVEVIGENGVRVDRRHNLLGGYVLDQPIPRNYDGCVDPEIRGVLYENSLLRHVYVPKSKKLSDLYAFLNEQYKALNPLNTIYIAIVKDVEKEKKLHEILYDNLENNLIIKDVSHIASNFNLISPSVLPSDCEFNKNVEYVKKNLYEGRHADMLIKQGNIVL